MWKKDVVEGKLVSISGGTNEAMKDVEGQGENDATRQNESEPSFEELFDPL